MISKGDPQKSKYIAYYYDNTKDNYPDDTNELSVNGKFLSAITHVRTSNNLAELQPRNETEEIVLLVPQDSNLAIDNFNPFIESFLD